MNIVLIGFRATGKTTIGRELAKRLSKRLISTDNVVEKMAKKDINGIVKAHGWKKFRELEKKAIEEIGKMDNCVIDTGGGAIVDEENVQKLKKKGIVILLETDKKRLMERIKRKGLKKRPSLTGLGVEEEVEQLLKERSAKYKKASDFTVDTSGIGKKEERNVVIDKIILYLKKEKVL